MLKFLTLSKGLHNRKCIKKDNCLSFYVSFRLLEIISYELCYIQNVNKSKI